MRRLLITLASIALLLSACGQHTLDEVYYEPEQAPINAVASPTDTSGSVAALTVVDWLQFHSLEEFLYAYELVRSGDATGTLATMAVAADLASLVELPLLTVIPDGFKLDVIRAHNETVSLYYVPESFLVSEVARLNVSSEVSFQLRITRWDMNDPMEGIMRQFGFGEEDMVDGVFFRERTNSLHLAHGNERITLRLPESMRPNPNTRGITDIHHLIPLTQTTTINLLDEALVTELIGDMYQLDFNLGIPNNADGSPAPLAAALAPFYDADPIAIPSNANILNFVAMHHDHLNITNPTRLGYIFTGWFMDADFTMPVSQLITRMPDHDVTLYARWQQ